MSDELKAAIATVRDFHETEYGGSRPGEDRVASIEAVQEARDAIVNAVVYPQWLKQPDGPGWWWHDDPTTAPEAPPYPKCVYDNMTALWGGEYTHASKIPGKWCRAIVPQPPEVK